MSTADPVGNGLLRSIQLFQAAIDTRDNLEIIAEELASDNSGVTVLVIEDSNVSKQVAGHQIEVDLTEIFSVVRDEHTAENFIKALNREVNPIRLNGVTRIVGYYSRVNNWNKSKIGELRDRVKGSYALGSHVAAHEADTLKMINSH